MQTIRSSWDYIRPNALHARDDTKLWIDVALLAAIMENGDQHDPSTLFTQFSALTY